MIFPIQHYNMGFTGVITKWSYSPYLQLFFFVPLSKQQRWGERFDFPRWPSRTQATGGIPGKARLAVTKVRHSAELGIHVFLGIQSPSEKMFGPPKPT